MTARQRTKLMAELWPNACAVQGWSENDRDKRLEVINGILAEHPHHARRRVIQSASELDEHTDFTLVKTRLEMLADNLRAAGEDGDLTPNAIRTRRQKVRQHIKCLRLYLDPRPSTLAAAQQYALEIIRDSAARAGYEPQCFDDATFERVLCQLEFGDLHKLMMTLNNRLNHKKYGYRVKAGHTLHDMLTQAGLKCPCKQCETHRIKPPEPIAVPAGDDPDWSVQ